MLNFGWIALSCSPPLDAGFGFSRVVARVVGVDDVDVIAPLGPPGLIESVICPAFALIAVAVSDCAADCDFVQARAP